MEDKKVIKENEPLNGIKSELNFEDNQNQSSDNTGIGLSDVLSVLVNVIELLFPKHKQMNTSVALNSQAVRDGENKPFDLVSLAVDIALPYILDNFFFKGTKGRLVKLLGTVAVQQTVKALAKSNLVDDLLDQLEAWLKEGKYKSAETYPAMNEAVEKMGKKRWNKTKPEDYYDPEREMFY